MTYNPEYSKKWKNENPDYFKIWNNKNPDYFKIWNNKNKEYKKNKNKTYYLENKEVIKKYVKSHPEKRLIIMKRHLEKYGKTFEMNPEEFSFALQAWSKTIKKLDNFMCKLCDSKENINAHHIQPKQRFPELSLDIDNGITLCKLCHGELHGFGLY